MESRKKQLFMLIRDVGIAYGEDLEWLREYATDVYEKYSNDLDSALECFENLKTGWANLNPVVESKHNSGYLKSIAYKKLYGGALK